MLASVHSNVSSLKARSMTRPLGLLAPLAALAGLAACGQGDPAPASAPEPSPAVVQVADALCRPTPNGRDVTGCYVTLTAGRDDRLVSASSPRAREAQIHEMKAEGGMMRMSELPDGLPLPAGETVRLAPGGDHIMLYGLDAPLREGDQVSLVLNFESSPQQGVRFTVGQPAVQSGR